MCLVPFVDVAGSLLLGLYAVLYPMLWREYGTVLAMSGWRRWVLDRMLWLV